MASTPLTKPPKIKVRVRTVFRLDRSLVDLNGCQVVLPDGPFNLLMNPDVAKEEIINNKRCREADNVYSNSLAHQKNWLHHVERFYWGWSLQTNSATMASPISPFDLISETNNYGFRNVNQNFQSNHSIFFDGKDVLDNGECMDFVELGVSFDNLFMLEPDYV